MGQFSGSHNDVDDGQPFDPFAGSDGPSGDDTPTRPILGASMGDRCVSCGASLASDQRYCLKCGERRGRSRFSSQSISASASQAQHQLLPEPREPPRRRLSSGATLITGIATLLLAMGVGVLIGHLGKGNNNTPTRASAPIQVVTLAGGGGPAATTTPAASTAGASNGKASKGKSKKAKPTVVTKKVAAKATQAASKVLGASAQNLAPPTVQQGQSCSHGAGCQNGRFTGNFFGP